MNDVTLILQGVEMQQPEAVEKLLPVVYEELRRIAAGKLAQENAGHTLQPTALVHEAWLRLVGHDGALTGKGRAYFFAAAAEAMRRILVEHARRKSRLKHGGGLERLDIQGLELADVTVDDRIILINDALAELEKHHPERARVVVLKYFGGLTNKELAETLGLGERTVNRHWLCAKQWLFQRIRAEL
jgi:RNA polymerase sigma factor (TIGR02999 family)